LIEQNRLLSIFNINSFDKLQEAIYNLAPSMCEYYLNDLILVSTSEYLNKTNIQQTINLDIYDIHIDYNSQVYIESTKNYDDTETQSLW
jgi:hypothetical protein